MMENTLILKLNPFWLNFDVLKILGVKAPLPQDETAPLTTKNSLFYVREVPEGVYLARSLPDALSLINSEELSKKVENVHVIGGSSVYKVRRTYCKSYMDRFIFWSYS